MKRILFVFAATSFIGFNACNNGDKSADNAAPKVAADTVKHAADSASVAEVVHSYSNMDPALATTWKAVVAQYLDIKNALVSNSGAGAADGGRAMVEAMGKVDKSRFTAEQKKLYNGVESDLKENAEHIGKSGGDIAHQREHFSMMSEDMVDLVKAFGGGGTLYHDHCPMANDQKGAMWLSEKKEVQNPYFGGKMNECVKVVEIIK